jgi:hypothetical protein
MLAIAVVLLKYNEGCARNVSNTKSNYGRSQ